MRTAVAILLIHVWAAPASAQFDDFESPEPPVVTHRARPFHNNVELTLMFAPSVIEKYLSHLGGFAGVAFHINNVIALEALGGYEYMRESAIIGGDQGVRFRIGGTREPHLPGMLGMSWVALAGLTIAPIYGKLSFFSEVDFNSQIYFILGGGAVGAVKRQLSAPGDADSATVTYVTNQGVRPAIDAGIGFRLFILKWLAIRAELRDIVYWDNADLLENGSTEFDLINNFMGCFGLSFIVN